VIQAVVLVVPVGDEEVGLAVVVVVGERVTGGEAVPAHGRITLQPAKRAVAGVHVETVGLEVVGDEEIEISVIVDIGPAATARGGGPVRERGVDDLGEAPVAIVAVEAIRLPNRSIRAVGDEQIQVAVVVVVAPAAAVGERGVTDDDAIRDPGKRAVSPVPIEEVVLILAVGDEQVEITIVVVVAPGGTEGLAGVVDNRTLSDPLEYAASQVAIQEVVLVPTIGHEQVESAVVVVVPPRGGERGTAVTDDGPFVDLGEGAVTVVEVEEVVVVALVGYEEVEVAVVVAVAPARSG